MDHLQNVRRRVRLALPLRIEHRVEGSFEIVQNSTQNQGSRRLNEDGTNEAAKVFRVMSEDGDPMVAVDHLGNLQMYGKPPEDGTPPKPRMVLKGALDTDLAHGMIDVLRDWFTPNIG